jgi:hypothetical protein
MIKNGNGIETCDRCDNHGEFYINIPALGITNLVSCEECEQGLKKQKEIGEI